VISCFGETFLSNLKLTTVAACVVAGTCLVATVEARRKEQIFVDAARRVLLHGFLGRERVSCSINGLSVCRFLCGACRPTSLNKGLFYGGREWKAPNTSAEALSGEASRNPETPEETA